MWVRVVHVIKLHVFMFLAPCCYLHYDFRIKTMLDSSGLPFDIQGVQVLFILFDIQGVQVLFMLFVFI